MSKRYQNDEWQRKSIVSVEDISKFEVDFTCLKKRQVVSYDTEDHFSVLFQMHGSVWGKVLPYCLFNLSLAFTLWYLKNYNIIDLSVTDKGQGFVTTLVAFLVVARSSIMYDRYMEARKYLSNAGKACRELVQHVIIFSRFDTSDDAKYWRLETTRRTLALLRTLVHVLESESMKATRLKVYEDENDEERALLEVDSPHEPSIMPLILYLRSSIASSGDYLSKPLSDSKELKIDGNVTNFIDSYYGLMKLCTTPYPFPLAQMARTFLFIWIFNLPFILVGEVHHLVSLLVLVFLVTYGFFGLEFVSIEISDPFGEDPNDFDVEGIAKVAYIDIFNALYDLDGKEAAISLRQSVQLPLKKLFKQVTLKHKDSIKNLVEEGENNEV